jgi:UDP-N-acetylglucosamine--N-acetylmuramyl-(pentapeptide) pyrophosphoryl-undecaprenol N-acetylglucosamine transferase
MKILIAGGGTGGHLFPALAVAEAFKKRDPGNQIVFAGSRRGLESKFVAREGYELRTIDAGALKGKGVMGKLRSLAAIPNGLWQSWSLLRSVRPALVLGVGGYASGPVVLAAWAAGYRTAIHEQNSFAGLSNRILGRFVDRVFISFEGSADHFPRSKTVLTGNPVRKRLQQGSAPSCREEKKDFTLFIFGGSQGAHRLNQAMEESLPSLKDPQGKTRFIHQTGDLDYDYVRAYYEREGVKAEIHRFIHDMDQAYAAADLILCRAGATTLFELMAVGKAAILVPYPHAANDHQTLNAKALVEAGAALMVADKDMNGQVLSRMVRELKDDPERLKKMGERAAVLAQPRAAEKIVELCYSMVKDES